MDYITAGIIRAHEFGPDDCVYGRERLDTESPEWKFLLGMFNLHAQELRNRDTQLNLNIYKQLQEKDRLFAMGARRRDNGAPVGYSIHTWHHELHYGLRVAEDEAWFVFPQYRNRGIGRRLREVALNELRKLGCKFSLQRFKVDHPHDHLMEGLGYYPYEMVFRKDL